MYCASILLGFMLLCTFPLCSVEDQGCNEDVSSYHVIPVQDSVEGRPEDVQEVQKEAEKEQDQEKVVEESDNLEKLLTLVEDVEIPVPEPKPLPRFITALIPYALSVVYTCNDIKEWLFAKLF